MNRFLILFLFFGLLHTSCDQAKQLPLISLQTSGNLDFDKKKPIAIHQITSSDTIISKGTAKWRGGWSRQFDKKSFTLDTEYPMAIAGMNPHTKWVLNASYIDKTLMRHRLWYELWQSMNELHEAATCRYVRLEVDGRHQGVYVAMERIHESRIGIEASGALFKDPQVFRRDTIAAEKDDSYFHQKYPDPEIENRDSLLHNFRDYILTSDSSTFSNDILKWVDFDNIIDWHLLLLLSHNGDGLLKNFYLYKTSENDRLKIIPWDYDHSAGRDGDNELNLHNTFIDDDRNILLDRLMRLNAQGYNDRRCERWWALRKSNKFTMKNTHRMIRVFEKELKSDIDQNFKIWPYDGPGYFDDNHHSQEVELMKTYIKNRIAFLDNYFDCNK